MKSWLTRGHARTEAEVPDSAELRAAYERGRRDERARRRKRPVLGVVVAGAALVGGAVLALAAMQGSFRDGGAVVDHQLAAAADRAEPVIRSAADEAGQKIRGVGTDASDQTGLAGG